MSDPCTVLSPEGHRTWRSTWEPDRPATSSTSVPSKTSMPSSWNKRKTACDTSGSSLEASWESRVINVTRLPSLRMA